MDAVHPSRFPMIRWFTAPVIPAWWPAGGSRRVAAGVAVRADHGLAPGPQDLDPAALRDVGLPARGMSAREQAARLLQRAGHG